MALFRPYERTAKTTGERISQLTPRAPDKTNKATRSTPSQQRPAANTDSTTTKPRTARKVRKKESPTPTRREAEAARMERLHPNLTPREQRKADARARSKARMAAWEKVENSPERRLLRDFVDARWTIAEFMMPAMILIMAAMMAFMRVNEVLATTIGMLLWVLLLASAVQTWLMWRGYKRLLEQRHPGTPLRGLFMYMFNRALMIRRFRQPSPRIKRGEPV